MTLGFVLLSEGIDSTTLVPLAIQDLGKENVRCVSINYGQRRNLPNMQGPQASFLPRRLSGIQRYMPADFFLVKRPIFCLTSLV